MIKLTAQEMKEAIEILPDIERKRKEMIKEAKSLFEKDGWIDLNHRTCPEGYYFILSLTGESVIRYLEWGEDYNEWHGLHYIYPGFSLYHLGDFSDIDDNLSDAFMVAKTVPTPTINSKKAAEILEEYWESFEEPC